MLCYGYIFNRNMIRKVNHLESFSPILSDFMYEFTHKRQMKPLLLIVVPKRLYLESKQLFFMPQLARLAYCRVIDIKYEIARHHEHAP